jgi:hypothetical protein
MSGGLQGFCHKLAVVAPFAVQLSAGKHAAEVKDLHLDGEGVGMPGHDRQPGTSRRIAPRTSIWLSIGDVNYVEIVPRQASRHYCVQPPVARDCASVSWLAY